MSEETWAFEPLVTRHSDLGRVSPGAVFLRNYGYNDILNKDNRQTTRGYNWKPIRAACGRILEYANAELQRLRLLQASLALFLNMNKLLGIAHQGI